MINSFWSAFQELVMSRVGGYCQMTRILWCLAMLDTSIAAIKITFIWPIVVAVLIIKLMSCTSKIFNIVSKVIWTVGLRAMWSEYFETLKIKRLDLIKCTETIFKCTFCNFTNDRSLCYYNYLGRWSSKEKLNVIDRIDSIKFILLSLAILWSPQALSLCMKLLCRYERSLFKEISK